MALARLVTFVPLTLIKSADVNGEFNNILNNPISLVSPTTGAINFNLQAHTNLLPSAITASSGVAGQALIVSSSGGVVFGGSVVLPSQVNNLNGTLSSQTGTFAADSYVMRTTAFSQSWSVTATSSYTTNIGTAGPTANGRDQAGNFASTYVHWYAISTGSGSTAPAGLVSSQPPTVGPTLPTGYTGWSYLGGSIYSSASTSLPNAHFFRGNEAFYLTNVPVLSGGNSTSTTAVALGGIVPANAPKVGLEINVLSTDGANNDFVNIYVTSSIAHITVNVPAVTGGIVSAVNNYLRVPQVNQQIFYNNSTNVPLTSINVTGYVIPNGDV